MKKLALQSHKEWYFKNNIKQAFNKYLPGRYVGGILAGRDIGVNKTDKIPVFIISW